MNELTFGDELFDPRANCVAMQVTSATLAMGRVRVLEANADADRWIPYEEVRAMIDKGALEVRRKGNPALAVFFDPKDSTTCKHKGSRYKSMLKAQATYQSSVDRALEVLNAVQDYGRRHTVSNYAAYHAVRQQLEPTFTNGDFPSLASVYRYIARDRCKAPLITANNEKGNRQDRHDPQMVELICTIAEATFLQEGSKWSLKDLTAKCHSTAIAAGIPNASNPLSSKFVYKVITTKLYAMPEAARLLGKDRAAKMSVGSHRIQVEGILQRVEQDTLNLPMVIMTEDGPCSDVNLVHSIDCGSSNPTGWHLKIGAPNESDGLRCVESTLFSKEASFKYFGIDDSHDLYGTPAFLVLDNGAEGRGDRFRRLAQLGIAVGYCKARHPHKKPFIERLNRSLKEALQLQPGCTRMDGVDGARDPVALGDKLMTLKELERWIVHWYFNVWVDTVLERFVDEEVSENRGLGVTPRQRFQNIVERLGCHLPLPPNRADWIRTKYDAVSRKLNMKSGVTLEGYDFKGDNLVPLLHRFGQQPVDVLYDPEDYRRVYVVVGTELVELVNQSATEFSPAHSFAYAKENRERLKSENPESARSAAYKESVYDASMEQGKKGGRPQKSPNRTAKKEVVAKTVYRAAVNQAALNPLPPSKPKTSSRDVSMSMRLDDVDELSPRDRRTGVSI